MTAKKSGEGNGGGAISAAAMSLRLEPFIRRGVLAGGELVRVSGTVAGDALDLLEVTITSDTNPDHVAAEIEGLILSDADSVEPASFYRVEVEGGTKPSKMVIRPPRRTGGTMAGQDDVLFPRGMTSEQALLRLMARHSENAVARAVGAQDKALTVALTAIETMGRANEQLRAQLVKDAEAAGAHHRGVLESEAKLLEASGKAEAAREVARTLRYMAPRIVDKISGADKFAPVLRMVANLDPDKIEMAVKVGMISGEEAEAIAELWHELKDEKRDRRALRSDNPQEAGAKVVRLRQAPGEGGKEKG